MVQHAYKYFVAILTFVLLRGAVFTQTLPTPVVDLSFSDAGNLGANSGSATGVTFESYADLYPAQTFPFPQPGDDPVTQTSGPGGMSAGYFDGNTGYQASSSPVTSAFTVTMWINTTQVNGSIGDPWYYSNGLVNADLPGTKNDWGVGLIDGHVSLGTGDENSTTDWTLLSNASVATGQWVFVAAVFDSASGTQSIYIDGVLDASATHATNTNARETGIAFTVGAGYNSYQGSLSDVRLYDTALDGSALVQIEASAVPEPATYGLMAALGVYGFVAWKRKSLRLAA